MPPAGRPTNKVLTDDDKRAFIRDGYIVLRGVVPPDVVEAAIAAGDEAFDNGDYSFEKKNKDPVPTFKPHVAKHKDIGQVLQKTNIREACVDLLGAKRAKIPRRAQLAYRFTDRRKIDAGMGIEDDQDRLKYHIDGGNEKYYDNGSAFSLLVGVCLSEGQHVDENRGQFVAWPGSHKRLHEVVRERWRAGKIHGHGIFGKVDEHEDIGAPKRVLLYPGDAVLAHQRLGHAGGVNLHDDTRKNLYFRVHHKRHEDLLYKYLQGSVFTEFEGLHHLLDHDERANVPDLGLSDDDDDADDA